MMNPSNKFKNSESNSQNRGPKTIPDTAISPTPDTADRVNASPPANLKRLAERLWEYEPTAVLWEPDGSLRACEGEALRSVMPAAFADDRAPLALYDAFRTPDNEHVIVLQATEDTRRPHNFKFHCDGELMPHEEIASGTRPRLVSVQRIQLNCRPPPDAPLRMTVEADGHSAQIVIPPYPFADWRKVALTQVVFQKDYPMVWVRDQALFYHRAHGYERMVVYDNNSANVAELKDCLAQLDEGLQVLLIRWPFPWFRPRTQKRPGVSDVCSQIAAYNHHMHLIASRSIYVSQFDLDEYLMNRSGRPLIDYLESQDKDTHYVWEDRVANVTASRSDTVRAADFKWHSRDDALRHRGFLKYIYRVTSRIAPKIRFTHVHTMGGPHPPPLPTFREKLKPYILIKLRLWDGCTFRFGFIESLSKAWQRWRARNFTAHHSPKTLVLFHYVGIYNNWRSLIKGKEVRPREPLDPAQHEFNDEMSKLLTRLGLADTGD